MIIGIIGPRASCDITERNLHYIDRTLEIKCYIGEQTVECGEVIDICQQECDAVLFTGRAVERYVKQHSTVYKPSACISRSIISMAGAFLKMQKQGMALDAFSVDIIEPQVIEDILDAYEILAKNIYSYPEPEDTDEINYVRWHKSLQDEGRTNVALTSFQWVSKVLQADGYNVIYMGPTRAMVRLALERVQNDMAINRAEYAQIAAEILHLDHVQILEENYYSGMLQKAEIDKEVIRYAKQLQAAVFPAGPWEYMVFANAGVLTDQHNQNELLNLQKEIGELGLYLEAGIGMGKTAYGAELNARKALNYAQSRSSGNSDIYWIDEHNVINGPINREKHLRFQLISSDPKIMDMAEKTGLSASSILKIRAIMETRQSDVFDAHELADCLELTSRSARRIMNRIIDAGYGEVYAKDNAAVRGRPKMLIRIFFDQKSETNDI